MSDLLAKVSPSKLGMFGRCQYQFLRHYVMGENKPPSIALAFGSAFDIGSGAMLSDGISMGKVGPVSVGQDAFALAWGWEKERVADWEGEDPGKLEDQGVRLVAHWREEACHGLVPLASQERFEVPLLPGLALEGVLDGRIVREDKERVLEIKTAGKPWRTREARAKGAIPTKAMQSLQAPAYTLAATVRKGAPVTTCEFHVGARGGKSDIDCIPMEVSQAAMRGYTLMVARMKEQASECMRTGTFLPTAMMCGHFLCSKKFCGWWRECVAEFGGERPD